MVKYLFHLLCVQLHIIEKVIDFLKFQDAFLFLAQRNKFFQPLVKFLCVFFHVSILPLPTAGIPRYRAILFYFILIQ